MDEEGTSSSQPHESNITSQLRASSYPDDEPIAHNLLCCEDTEMSIDPIDIQCAWRCELEVPRHISPKEMENMVSRWYPSCYKQRTEVKLSAILTITFRTESLPTSQRNRSQ